MAAWRALCEEHAAHAAALAAALAAAPAAPHYRSLSTTPAARAASRFAALEGWLAALRAQ